MKQIEVSIEIDKESLMYKENTQVSVCTNSGCLYNGILLENIHENCPRCLKTNKLEFIEQKKYLKVISNRTNNITIKENGNKKKILHVLPDKASISKEEIQNLNIVKHLKENLKIKDMKVTVEFFI